MYDLAHFPKSPMWPQIRSSINVTVVQWKVEDGRIASTWATDASLLTLYALLVMVSQDNFFFKWEASHSLPFSPYNLLLRGDKPFLQISPAKSSLISVTTRLGAPPCTPVYAPCFQKETNPYLSNTFFFINEGGYLIWLSFSFFLRNTMGRACWSTYKQHLTAWRLLFEAHNRNLVSAVIQL